MHSSAVSIPDKATTRPATAGDLGRLCEIAARSYAHAFAGILTAGELASKDAASFRDRFEADRARMTVVETAGGVAGFALVSDGHIAMFFLDPDVIGGGLGRVLLEAVERGGARSLECFASNGTARRFYERAGWRQETAYERDYLGRTMAFVRYVRSDQNETS